MGTQQVNFDVPNDGWTGSIDVTLSDLLTDNSIKDFIVLYNGSQEDADELALWSKSSQGTLLTYSGSSLNTGDTVGIRRKTPNKVVQRVAPNSIILSALWNKEFDRLIRWREEKEVFSNPFSTIPEGTVINAPFSSSWDGDETNAPSRNSVYDELTTLVTDYFTGDVDLTTLDSIQYPTRATVPIGGEYGNFVATQSWVYNNGSHNVFQARLSLSETEPFARDITSSNLYLHPYNGNTIWLYNTTDTRWEPSKLSGTVSLALSGLTVALPYDVYVYDNSGTLTLELTEWTDRDTRATSIVRQDGVPVKTGELNKRFIGVLVPRTATTCEIGDDQTVTVSTDMTITYVGLVNYYNTVKTCFKKHSNISDGQYSTFNASNGAYFHDESLNDAYDTTKYELASLALHESINSYLYQFSTDIRTNSGTGIFSWFLIDNNFANDTGTDFDNSPLTSFAVGGINRLTQTSYGSMHIYEPFGTSTRGNWRVGVGGVSSISAIRFRYPHINVTLDI